MNKIFNQIPKYFKHHNRFLKSTTTISKFIKPTTTTTTTTINNNNNNNNNNNSNNNIQFFTTCNINNNNNNKPPTSNMVYSPKDRSYEESINALLSLQSNQSVIISWTKERKNNKEECTKYLMEEMAKFCKSLDIDLNKQSIIHVAGTKGKGSTCAITESIIREQGFTTGLFTSPHLISPRERIRINGEMISKEMFAKYFWICWDKLNEDFKSTIDTNQFPNFFRFLTLMAFRIFQDENIQCTILEVGIGGRMDSTNIFPHPIVTGISALGYDHMNLLGDTLGEIALEKAGIMKSGIPVFTVDSQLPEAMQVLINHSKKMNSPLSIVPNIKEYSSNDDLLKIGLQGEHQLENSSLAIALANCWLTKQTFKPLSNVFHHENSNYLQYNYQLNNYSAQQFIPLSQSFENGLKNCNWAGRAQHFTSPEHFKNMDFYLDGAHTPESSIVMLNWWKSIVNNKEDNNNNTVYVLIFNSTGGRNPNSFLKPIIQSIENKEIPIFNQTIIPNIIIEKPIDKKYYIKELLSSTTDKPDNAVKDQQLKKESTWEDFVVDCYNQLSNKSHPCIATDSIESSIELAQSLSENGTKNVKVLITGSLYLVGGVLKVLLKEKSFT